MGPLRDSKAWNTSGIEGVHRFLGRTWRLIIGPPLPDGTYRDGTVVNDDEPTSEQLRSLNKCINKVAEEIEGTRFNTGISAMMEFINAAYKEAKKGMAAAGKVQVSLTGHGSSTKGLGATALDYRKLKHFKMVLLSP